MERLFYWFRSFTKLKTIEQAKAMNLVHFTNVHGDGIDYTNCRSFWKDKYENIYLCEELYIN